MEPIEFAIRFVSAGTGSAVWDNTEGPNAHETIQRFMPPDRRSRQTVGIVHLGPVRPTSHVLRDVVSVGEDVKAGRYGEFSLVVSSDDEVTRSVIGDMAAAHEIAMFVSSSSLDLEQAEPVGVHLTPMERETLDLVLQAGGTVTAMDFAGQIGIEHTAAGNRLVSLHKKGYLQRRQRAHPDADQFLDPRSVLLKSLGRENDVRRRSPADAVPLRPQPETRTTRTRSRR